MIITISRQAATNGGTIGHLVAERMGLRIFDRELVDEIARRMHVEPADVVPYDETALSPVQSILWEWRTAINEQAYGRYLRRALEHIFAEGDAVVIGRGANFVLRCATCLHIRIVAPLPLRVAIFRTANPTVSEREAERLILQEDHERAHFVRAYFHHDINDPEQYDLTINLAGLTPETAADLISYTARSRAQYRLPPEPHATLPQHVEVMARRRRPLRPGVVEKPERR